MSTKEITAEQVRALREQTGMGMAEARQELARRNVLALLDSPLWFLRIRTVLRYLVQIR